MFQFIKDVLSEKCPRCHKGHLFKYKWYNFNNANKMVDKCPVCGQRTELEPGFFHGTGYVSYSLSVAYSVFTFVLWIIFTGHTLKDKEIFWWLPINVITLIILQPKIMRLSRVLWLTMFFHSDDKFHQKEVEK
jgi:uncharacterized protein (DUF983 family)